MSAKTFVVSLHRCGTQSVDALLRGLGLSAKHWPETHDGVDIQSRIVGRETDLDFVAACLEPVIADFDAVSDVPICALYEPLSRIYPDAKFIALDRPTDAWIASVHRHIGARDFDPYERVQYWRYLDRRPSNLAEAGDDDLARLKVRHYREIERFFAGTGRLYLGDLDGPQVGPDICRFLGRDSRDLPRIDYLSAAQQS